MGISQSTLNKWLADGETPVTILDLIPIHSPFAVLQNASAIAAQIRIAVDNPAHQFMSEKKWSLAMSNPNSPEGLLDEFEATMLPASSFYYNLTDLCLDRFISIDVLRRVWDWAFGRITDLDSWTKNCMVLAAVIANPQFYEDQQIRMANLAFQKLDQLTRVRLPSMPSPKNPFPHRDSVQYRKLAAPLINNHMPLEYLIQAQVVDALSAVAHMYDDSRYTTNYRTSYPSVVNPRPEYAVHITKSLKGKGAQCFWDGLPPEQLIRDINYVTEVQFEKFVYECNLSGDLHPILSVPIATIRRPGRTRINWLSRAHEFYVATNPDASLDSLQALALNEDWFLRRAVVNNSASTSAIKTLASLIGHF